MEVSVQQVRAHLEQMGFADVPDDVLHELRGELLARMSSAAPTPQHPLHHPPKITNSSAGYEADYSEWEQREKENEGTKMNRQRASKADYVTRTPAIIARDQVKEASIRDKRPSTAPTTITRSRGGAGGAAAGGACAVVGQGDVHRQQDAVCSHSAAAATLARPASRAGNIGAGKDSAGAEMFAFEIDGQGGGMEQGGSRAGTVCGSSVYGAARSVTGSTGIIRPATQMYGRVVVRADPVLAYKNTLQHWKHAPAVTAGGTTKKQVAFTHRCTQQHAYED